MQHVQFLKQFEWILLDKPPVWDEIDQSARILIEKDIFPAENHQRLFHNYGILRAIMNDAQIAENEREKLSIGDRWVKFFKKCAKEDHNCNELIRIVSNVLTIPGIEKEMFKNTFDSSLHSSK